MTSVAGGSQDKNEILVKTEEEEYVLKGRPCELSAFSYVPPERNLSKDRTYFNLDKKVSLNNLCLFSNSSITFISQERYKSSTYDRLFLKDFTFEQALHRDDREHAKSRGLRVNEEVSLQRNIFILYNVNLDFNLNNFPLTQGYFEKSSNVVFFCLWS